MVLILSIGTSEFFRYKSFQKRFRNLTKKGRLIKFHCSYNSQDVKGKNCAFYDKIMKPCTIITLQVLNKSGYRGIAEKPCNKN